MGLKAKIKTFHYRMTMRKALAESSREELQIALEEIKREIEIRNKKNGK